MKVTFVLLALVGALTPASARGAERYEAERMHVAPGTGRDVRDVSAGGGRALLLVGPGRARGRVQAAARSRVTVVARARRCAGAPRLVLTVDGAPALSRRIRTARWNRHRARRVLAAGAHRVTLRLTNPHRERGCRRGLRVDALLLDAAPERTARWVPGPRTTWQWQLDTPIDQDVDADMFDIDLFDNSAAVVAALHRRGRRVVCYMSAGSFERGRPDSGSFPDSVLGKPLEGWPGERWLDVRRLDVLRPILERRLDLCAAKGFDGVEPDNVDGYANESGFALSAADQLEFNRFLAGAAHARGLSVGLKNDLGQAAALEPSFDWALNEQCFQYDECERLRPFVRAGKAVFVVEYELDAARFCPQARASGFMAMRKRLDLDAWREPCW